MKSTQRYLNEEQAQRILVEWAGTRDEYDKTESVWDAVEAQALANPQRIAVVDGTTEVSLPV